VLPDMTREQVIEDLVLSVVFCDKQHESHFVAQITLYWLVFNEKKRTFDLCFP